MSAVGCPPVGSAAVAVPAGIGDCSNSDLGLLALGGGVSSALGERYLVIDENIIQISSGTTNNYL